MSEPVPVEAVPPPYVDPTAETAFHDLEKALFDGPAVLLSLANLPSFRELMDGTGAGVLEGRALAHDEFRVRGAGGDPDVVVSVFAKDRGRVDRPALYFVHGGGMVMGNRFTDIETCLDAAERFDLVVVSPEYRLAPEHPDPAPANDCYLGLRWMADHARDLGIDPERIVAVGPSSGGGLVAGVALRARDERGPRLAGQMLICPMLDDRNDSVSARQGGRVGVWTREENEVGWQALLGERRRTDEVSIYAAPARATDLSGLPPTYIDVGSADVFRDEDVAYASRIWASGGNAELHVWPGGVHGSEVFAPDAGISRDATDARIRWLGRVIQ
jgi:acetyl esterase/lipase